MFPRWQWLLTMVCAAGACAAGQPWKDKKIPEWTEADAQRVLSESPWVKKATPEMTSQSATNMRPVGAMGRGRYGGMGGRGGVYPQPGPAAGHMQVPLAFTLRWESALPIRAGALKAHETSALSIDEDHYAIAVYGVPDQMARGSSDSLAAGFKKHAVLKREGHKDFKPSSVEVLQLDAGLVIVYLFPRSTEIAIADHQVEFAAEIGPLKFSASFVTDEMVYGGSLEL